MNLKQMLILASLGLAALSCSVPTLDLQVEQTLSREEFLAQEVKPYQDGYLVEGDIYLLSMAEVEAYYVDNYVQGQSRSTVMIYNGARSVWSASQKVNITYCISNAFGANKQKIIDGMAMAERDWESAANINLVYVPSQDGNATARNNNVVFNIRPASASEESSSGAAARTFFPHYPRSQREFVMWRAGFGIDPGYLYTHEIGHALGLRHEHIWFPTSNTESSANAQVLNAKDSASIMYYYYLAGYTGNKRITALDRNGLRILYGAPVARSGEQ